MFFCFLLFFCCCPDSSHLPGLGLYPVTCHLRGPPPPKSPSCPHPCSGLAVGPRSTEISTSTCPSLGPCRPGPPLGQAQSRLQGDREQPAGASPWPPGPRGPVSSGAGVRPGCLARGPPHVEGGVPGRPLVLEPRQPLEWGSDPGLLVGQPQRPANASPRFAGRGLWWRGVRGSWARSGGVTGRGRSREWKAARSPRLWPAGLSAGTAGNRQAPPARPPRPGPPRAALRERRGGRLDGEPGLARSLARSWRARPHSWPVTLVGAGPGAADVMWLDLLDLNIFFCFVFCFVIFFVCFCFCPSRSEKERWEFHMVPML